jgi:CHAT domain-containing protein
MDRRPSGCPHVAAAALAALLCNGAFGPPAWAQSEREKYALPPRSVEDVVRALDRYRQDPALAERALAAASAQPPATQDAKSLLEFYLARGRAAVQTGAGRQAIEDLRKAVEYGRVGNYDDFSAALHELGNAEATYGNWLSALRSYEEVTRVASPSSGGTRLAGNANIVRSLAHLGDMRGARRSLARTEYLFRAFQTDNLTFENFRANWTALIERARGTVLEAEGKLPEAESAMRRALRANQEDQVVNKRRLASRVSTPPQVVVERFEIFLSQDLARVLRLEGRLVEAESVARRALELAVRRHGRYSTETGGTINVIASIIYEQGRYAEAEQLARAAIDTLEKSGVAPENTGLANARLVLGWTLSAQESWADAVAAFETRRAGVQADPNLARRFDGGDVHWGYALVKTGAAERAATMLGQLYRRSRERAGDRDYRTARARGYYAVALAANGDSAAALKEFSQAAPALIEQQQADQGADTGGAARSLHLARILEAYIALLVERVESGTPVPGLDATAESFRLADVARGSHVQRALTASAARANLPDPQLAGLARREQDASRRIGVLGDLLSALLAAPPEQQLPNVIAQMKGDVEALRAERAQIKREIERRFPEYAGLVDPKPATLAQAQGALLAGEALVSIYSAHDRTYVWAFSGSGAPALAAVPLGRRQIAERVAKLRRALDIGEARIAAFPKYDVALAHELYRDLLAPVAPAWKGAKSLLMVQHLALGQIPFALLVTAPATPSAGAVAFEEYRRVPWLVRELAVSQLPSVASLVSLRAIRATAGPGEAFIGFGDPIFSEAQLQLADASASTTQGIRTRNLSIGRVATQYGLEAGDATAPGVANTSTLAQLARLPDTADEIREIARALGADPQRDVFLGVRASERRVKTIDLSNRRVVAFATHGLVPGDLNGLSQPALALTAPEISGDSGDDGLLTMDEILGLKLNADWVVLSACNTASGEGSGSEAVSGLGRAFFYAGARALLVSNWPVETVSARLLTTDLFRRQAENPGLSRAEALRQTMLSLMDGPGAKAGPTPYSYAHPMFWAPFSLVGDGSAR